MPEKFSINKNWKVYGSSAPRILIAGHSHTFAMYVALMNSPELQKDFAIVSNSDFTKHIPQDDEYWNFAASLSETQITAISWNGNQHNIHFLVQDGSEFKTINFNQDSNCVAISEFQVEEVFRPTFYELELILSRFPRPENVCLLGTPPPKSKSFLDRRLNSDSYFVDLARKAGLKDKKIYASSDNLRVYMWEITQILTEQTALKFGAKFFKVPKSSHNEKFILNRDFYTEDLTHANEKFGELMIRELAKFFALENSESSI